MANEHIGSLAQEIKQTKPFRSTENEAVLGLWRTAERLRNFVIKHAGLGEITIQQYNVLRILRGAGPSGLPTLEIGNRLVEQTPGVTRMIDRLVTKGLVGRERCKSDRRVVYCKLTNQGADLLSRYDGPVEEAGFEAMKTLSEQEQEQLVRLLDRVRAGLQENSDK